MGNEEKYLLLFPTRVLLLSLWRVHNTNAHLRTRKRTEMHDCKTGSGQRPALFYSRYSRTSRVLVAFPHILLRVLSTWLLSHSPRILVSLSPSHYRESENDSSYFISICLLLMKFSSDKSAEKCLYKKFLLRNQNFTPYIERTLSGDNPRWCVIKDI